ncbi:MAG: ABC transporter permease [Anaerolineae bacterium]|nr:ABC transporter permease [Anaerolineae bacterium]
MIRRDGWRPAVLGLFLMFMLVPLAATVLFSISTRWDRTIFPEGLTLQWWFKVTERSAFVDTLTNSLILSFVTVLLALLLVAPTAYWSYLRVPRSRPLMDILTFIPFGIPGVVLALALIRFYSNVPLPLINTPALLVAACMVISMPFMYRPVANALEAVDIRLLTEAAQSLGAGWSKTFVRVVLPNILPGILSGCLLVFSAVFAEFTLVNLLVGTRFKTFPIYLVEFTRFDGRQASALAVISFAVAWLISLLIIWVVGRGSRPTEALGAR